MRYNLLKMKKAQIQSGETITVMIIVMIMLIIGLVFYSSFQGSGREEERIRENQINAMSTAMKTVNMDEIKCTELTSRIDRCVDLYRLNASKEIIQQNYEYYFSFFSNTNVTIHFVSEEKEPINIYSYTGEFSSQTIPTYLPIIIKDPVRNKNIFGYIEVTTFRWKKHK